MRDKKRFTIIILAFVLFMTEIPWGVLETQAQSMVQESENSQMAEVTENTLEGPTEDIVLREQSGTENMSSETIPEETIGEEIIPENTEVEDTVVEGTTTEEVTPEDITPVETLPDDKDVEESEDTEGEKIPEENEKLNAVELSVLEILPTEVTLTWNVNEEAEGYIIYLLNDKEERNEIANVNVGEDEVPEYQIYDLIPNSLYRFIITPYRIMEEERCLGENSQILELKTSALEAVSLRADVVGYNEIELEWDACIGAEGYHIYRKSKDKEYSVLYKILSADTLTYRDIELTYNETYYYKISPIIHIKDMVYEGEMSSDVLIKNNLPSTEIRSIETVDYKTLKICWDEVEGADGYEIYRSKSSDSGYIRAIRIVSPNKLFYNDKKVTPNETAYYKIRAYRNVDGERVYGNYSTVKSGKTMFKKVNGLKVTVSDYTTMNLSWGKVSGASKYQVYYSSTEKTGYKLLTTTTNANYTWRKPVCGKTYYFKVRAVKVVNSKNIYGSYSDIVSRKTWLRKPVVTASKKSYSSIIISWKKIVGAEKYEIYWSTSKDGTYKLLTTTAKTSCTHIGRKVDTTYYYKVRSIRNSAKSSFSTIVSAKTSLGKITELKTAKYSGGGYKISWKAADGAKTYKVYRSNTKEGTYKLLATTSKTYYNDKKAGKATCYYKVVGYRDSAKTATAGPVVAYTKLIGQGIDVSEYQGTINWKKVKNNGIKFAMLRIVKGKGSGMQADAQFKNYYEGARKAGINVGVYRYCYALTPAQAREEAYKVLKVLDGRELEYPIVLDVEDSTLLSNVSSDSRRADIVLAFKEIVEDAGYEFAMYANLDWINNHLDMNKLSDVDIWLARWRDYNRGPGYMGKGKLIMWQYSCTGKVDGISGYVDMDVSY